MFKPYSSSPPPRSQQSVLLPDSDLHDDDSDDDNLAGFRSSNEPAVTQTSLPRDSSLPASPASLFHPPSVPRAMTVSAYDKRETHISFAEGKAVPTTGWAAVRLGLLQYRDRASVPTSPAKPIQSGPPVPVYNSFGHPL